MRVVKKAEVRKNEILDAAGVLFAEKGFDGTSTNDILDSVGIARGTLYHHFKSKEDIMDALIERHTEKILEAAHKIAKDQSIPVEERLIRTVLAMHVDDQDEMLHHLHHPQNALMHQKTQLIILRRVPQILAGILEDGIEQGMINTPFPLECMEMVVAYADTIFDHHVFELTREEFLQRIRALIFHLERLLGVEEGKLDFVKQMFIYGEGENK